MTSTLRSYLLAACGMFMLTLASCSDDPVAPVEKKPLLSGPSSISFGDVSSGTCKDTTIRYDNTTGKAVTITSFTLAGSGFEWTGVALPAEVAAGASLDLKLRFCPPSMDTAKTTLEIKGTGGETVTISLSGYSSEIAPKVGSQYIYKIYETDESGVKIDGTDDIQTDIITAINQTYEGKSKVYIVSEEGPLSYYAKEDNGDISTYLSAAQGGPFGNLVSGWKRLPYGSKLQNVELTRRDTSFTVEIPGVPIPVSVTATITQIASYAGQTSMVVGSKTYPLENVTLTTNVALSALGSPLGNITNVVKGGYIKAIGYQGTFETQLTSTVTLYEVPTGGYVKTLDSFVIQ